MEVYGTAAVLAALFNVSVGVWIFANDPHSKITRRFLLATALLAFWGAAEAATKFSPNEQLALFWAKVSYVPFFMFPSFLHYTAHHISGGRWKIPFYASRVLYIISIILLFTDLFIKEIEYTKYGYEPAYGEIFPYFTLVYTSMVVLGFLFLFIERIKMKGLGRLHRVDVIFNGLIISTIFSCTFVLISPFFGWGLPKIGSIFFIFSTIALKYAYFQYRSVIYPRLRKQIGTSDAVCGALCSLCSSFFAGRCKSCSMGEEEKRKACKIYQCAKKKDTDCLACRNILSCTVFSECKEKCPFKDPVKCLPSGVSYRVESAAYSTARTIFRDRVIRGDFGLLVSREHPDIFFKEWDLEKTPVIWLSLKEENKWTISPEDLAKLTHMINNFIREVPVSCILFEGFEYLVIHNSFDSAMKLVYSIDDEVIQNKSRFMLSYDSRTFDRDELVILERELHPLPEGYVIE